MAFWNFYPKRKDWRKKQSRSRCKCGTCRKERTFRNRRREPAPDREGE